MTIIRNYLNVTRYWIAWLGTVGIINQALADVYSICRLAATALQLEQSILGDLLGHSDTVVGCFRVARQKQKYILQLQSSSLQIEHPNYPINFSHFAHRRQENLKSVPSEYGTEDTSCGRQCWWKFLAYFTSEHHHSESWPTSEHMTSRYEARMQTILSVPYCTPNAS
jgi:hypothetical protein